MRLDGQVRVAPNGAVIGWDMTAALALAEALGVGGALAAEFLPEIEQVMVQAFHERKGDRTDVH